MYLLDSLVFSAVVVARKRLFCLLCGDVPLLCHVPCQCRAFAWPFFVIKGAFTPDANDVNKSRYSREVGRLNILNLLASFA